MQKTIYNICNETYYIIRVINSCKTLEQLENANKWACSLIDKWYNMLEKISFYYTADVIRYIDSSATDMTKAIETKKEQLKSQQSEVANHIRCGCQGFACK